MTDGAFWFVMTCLVVLLDVLSYRVRARRQREDREWWAHQNVEAKRRHDEFMAAHERQRRWR